jgi:hypothetical protein
VENKDENGVPVVGAMENFYVKQPSRYQTGEVLSISDNARDPLFKKGDKVIFDNYRAQKLDLFAKKSDDVKCPLILPVFSVVAKINNENNE